MLVTQEELGGLIKQILDTTDTWRFLMYLDNYGGKAFNLAGLFGAVLLNLIQSDLSKDEMLQAFDQRFVQGMADYDADLLRSYREFQALPRMG
ncbi:MAG: hypothetical protein COV52_01535 [Gammaproteobacteria bacterium CG11_big_fil_rev_8_21_14_0_20_46_22]|nr:MAG: hypothetical protein COW05_05030 [Gammaproteobacteria bacterium CG12_big_fil_rev_8_21_14_0_65_46_12]PIR11937.1 MAG: hypothetical protein COV52_01535 [Gammaproteobacteria bacterium CG11_big_fil_rev_8_21_14_0_20_46_22]